jgi:adenylate kinase
MTAAAPSSVKRQRPNILITGTPGTGKTTLSELVALALNYEHINASELVKTRSLHDGYDEEFDTYILNDDKVDGLLLICPKDDT